MPRYTTEDLIAVLNHIEWKTVLQMMDEMADNKGLPRRSLRRLFGEPSIGWMHIQLEWLIEQELVEWREGTDKEKIKERRGRTYREYRLSPNGLRRKEEIIERNRKTHRVGSLAPRPI